jgi:hypothetical protein
LSVASLKIIFFMSILNFSLTVCSARYLDIEQKYAAVNCPVSDEGMVFLENQSQFESLVKQRDTLGLGSGASLSGLDFANYTYVLVAAGSKPHSGFRIELTCSKARLEGSTLYLPVEIVSPDPGITQIQMLISPYQVLALSKVSVKHIEADSKH